MILAAFLMLIMLGMVAFSVDVGYIATVKTELQAAADSAALAAAANLAAAPDTVSQIAKDYAAYHTAGGSPVQLASSDIEYGLWDAASRTFTPLGSPGTPGATVSNAIRVTAKRNNSIGNNATFFGRILGVNTFNAQAEAIAIGNPRDICFVVDLSGSMNDDTETGYTGNGTFSGSDAAVRTDMMQKMFDDFNFGTYPGTVQVVGYPLTTSTSSMSTNFSNLSSSSGLLTPSSISTTYGSAYRITSTDNTTAKRQTKAYKWLIDWQIKTSMPNAKPTPNSNNTASYNYWKAYIDMIISQNGRIGYRTYLHYMQYEGGRERKPDGSRLAPLSIDSPDCPLHSEATAGGVFMFPPREQPTHSARRSIIAALNEIKSKNSTINDPSQRDWVSIVTFDTVNGTEVALPLTSDYTAAMEECTKLQAVSNKMSSTATETGLIAAKDHIKAQSQGGSGRENTQKVVVLLTDGMANLKSSSDNTINSYKSNNPSSDWYSGSSSSSKNSNAALMQANSMNGNHWKLYSVGLGLGVDQEFMNRMARMGGTADDDGKAPQKPDSPSEYEETLSSIFKKIVDNPQVRLVK